MMDVNDEDDSYRFSSTSMKKNKPRQLRIKKTLVADDEEDNGPSNAIPPPTRQMQQQQRQQQPPQQLSPNQPQKVPVNTAKASPSPALVASDGSFSSSSSSSSQRHKRFHRASSSSSSSAKSPLSSGVARSRFSPHWESQTSREGKKTSTTTASTATHHPQRVGRSPPSRTKESIADDTEVFDLHAPTMYNSYRRRSRSRSQGDRVQDAVGEGQTAESSSVSLTSSSSSSDSGEETYEKYRKYLSTNDGNNKEDAAPWRKAQSQKKATMKIGAPPPLEYSYRYSASQQQPMEKEAIASPTLESNEKRRKSNSPRDRLTSNRIPQEDLEMVEIMLLGSSSEEDDSSTESPIPHQFVDGTTSEEDTSMGLQLETSSSHGSSSHREQQSQSTAEPSQRANYVMVKSEGKPSSGLGPLAMENGTERRAPNETSKQVPLRDSIQLQRVETHALQNNAAPYRGKELALGNRAHEGASSDTGATETKKDIRNIAFTTGMFPEGIYGEGVGSNEEKVPKAGGLQSSKTPPPVVQTEEQSGTVQDRIKQLEANSKPASTAVFQAEKNIGIISGESTIEEAKILESVNGDIVDMWETSVLEESKDVLEESFGQHSKRRGMTLLNSSRLSIGSRGSRRTQTQNDSLSQKSFGDSCSLRESDGDSVPLQPMGKMEEGNSSISKSTGLALARSGRYDVMTPSLAMSHLAGLNQPKQNDDSDSSASLGSDEVFDPAPKVLVSKPLLAAAVKGKQESETNAQYGSHLEGLNQPKQNDESDSSASLGSDEVFDPAPKVLVSKPLLAAAVKGKQESESNAQHGSHLEGLNQPKQNDDSDSSVSLGSDGVFDPAPKVLVFKPLLAAAVKGKQESESHAQYGSHLEGLNQPKQNDDSDSSASLGSGKVLDSAPKGLVSKPLVAAAVKGKKASQTDIDNGRQVHAMPSGAHPHTNHHDRGSLQQLLTPGVVKSDSEDSSDSVAIGGIMAMLEDDKSDEFSYQASHDISKDHGSISENSDYDHNKVRNKGYDDDFMNHGLHNLNASLSEHDPEEQMEPLVQSNELHSDIDSDSESDSDSSSSANVVAEKLIASSKSPSKAPEFFRCCYRGSIVLLLFAAIGLPLYFLVWYNDGDNGSTLPTETVPPLFPPLSPITPTIPVADPSSPPMSVPTQDSPTESPLPHPSFPTTSGPSGTSMHGSAEEARELLINKWPSLEEDWGDVRTPQFLALDWLTNDPNLDQYTEERILQRFSLATLYFSTDGDNWRRNDRWLSIENECLWYSAGSSLPCDDNLIYTALNLDLNGLSGTIPSELALLSNSLTRINFSSRESDTASLSGTIPNELGFLSLLEDVDFSGNELQGSIPAGLGKWSVIRSIDLSDNLLGGSLPFSITHWTSLAFLDIGNNSLESSVPSSIGLLTNLRQLNLSGNSFTGAVPSHVGRLNLLQVLYLHENQFTELPTEIGRLVLLQQLFANGNTIAGPIPTEIGRLMNLLSLNLSQNVMAGELPTELGRLISIRDELNLSENLLSGPLPTELGRLIFLRNLLLQSNRLTGSVPSTFARLNRLISLRLEDNSLTGTVPDNVCDVYDETFPIFVTDCLDDDEIICDCCMFCCQDGGGCECQFANTDLSFLCAEFTESPGLEQRIFGDMRY